MMTSTQVFVYIFTEEYIMNVHRARGYTSGNSNNNYSLLYFDIIGHVSLAAVCERIAISSVSYKR